VREHWDRHPNPPPAPEGRHTLQCPHHPDQSDQRRRLAQLTPALQVFDARARELPSGITLPEKDAPILLTAIEAQATHLVTGDVRHFGSYFGKTVHGVLVVTLAEYLKLRGKVRNGQQQELSRKRSA
jgi:hypothetical protein